MRIGIIAPPWLPIPPPAYGGLEVVVDNLARGLQHAGHDVLLHATGDSTCPVPRTAARGEAASTVGPAAPAAELHHVVHGYAEMRRWGADIVHDHTLAGPLYAAQAGVAAVTTNHGPFASELGCFYRAIAPRVPVFAISHHQASTARDTPIAAVIHHGVDVDSIAPGDGDGGYALFLGRMSPDKGVDTAARVARAAGVPLRIASRLSEPAEHDYFERAVEPLLGDGVTFVGEVGGRVKDELIAGAACLLNPIAWPEPFGMVMVEALARGVPVVATPCGSVPELVDDGVTGFIRSTVEALADAVRAAPLLDRRDCRRATAERFSTVRMVADHLDAYTRALAGRRPLQAA